MRSERIAVIAHGGKTLGGGLTELLHRLAHFSAHHALELGDRALHHGGEILERATDGDARLHGFELALELLNFAQAVRDDLGVLLVERLEIIELGFVLVDFAFDGGELLREVGAVGFVVGRGRRLQPDGALDWRGLWASTTQAVARGTATGLRPAPRVREETRG